MDFTCAPDCGLSASIAPLVNTAVMSNKANIEFYRQEQKLYDKWASKPELQEGIRLALLYKCNSQVRKALLAKHNIDQIENLTCQGITGIWEAAKDPMTSTFAIKEEGRADWLMQGST